MRHICGKTALVTGAASGIGRAIALKLADERARLYLVDINAAGLAAVVGEAKLRGVECLGRHCDVGHTAEVTAAVEDLLSRWGGLDILVNNAGVAYYGGTDKMPPEAWDRLLAVNLLAPIQFTRELLPALLARDESHILNVASICGLVGLARVAAYTTSKFGLVGFSESIRAENLRKGLGVTALCPGLVDTQLFAAAPLAHDMKHKRMPPAWLLATPESIARRAIRAIRHNEGLVIVKPYARALYWLKRWAPGVLDLANSMGRRRKGPPQPVDEPARRAA